MSTRTGALLLAAGFSNRFGGIKLVAELDNGQTVFSQTLARVTEALHEVVVVTRPELVEALAPLCDSLQVFDRAEQGMGATLAYGVSLLQDWDACLVCLADMPFIQTDSYRDIAARCGPETIVLPRYEGRSGNPVAFGRQFFAELRELRGDHGGRPVLQAHPEAITELSLSDAAICDDIDTPEDLARLQSALS